MKIAGMTKTEAKKFVSPRQQKVGFTTYPGEPHYEILKWSLDMRGDRDWYPLQDPDCFTIKVVETPYRKHDLNWNPVFDGESLPFSYLKGFNYSHRNMVLKAARLEVQSQIDSVAVKGMHVHHFFLTFADLFQSWLNLHHLTFDDIQVVDNQKIAGLRMKEPMGSSWRDYHERYSILEVLTKEEHKEAHSSPA